MEELLAQFIRFVRMAWHYRWLALATAFVVSIAGWSAVMTLPDRYDVNTKVYLDTSSMLGPVLRGLALNTNSREQAVNMVRRTLLTRPNLESVIRSTDMDLGAKTPEDFEGLVLHLRSSVNVSADKRNDIFSISYAHSDPQRALRVVEAFLNIFVEKSLGESRKDSSSTRQFLDQQIKDYEARLNASESRLEEFKRRNLGILSGSGESFYAKRQVAAQQMEAAQLELKEAANRRDELRRQLEGDLPASVKSIGPYSGRIRQLEEKLDNLLLKYTERHPDVVATKELIDQLTQQNEEAIAGTLAQNPSAEGRMAGRSEYAQMLKLKLGDAEGEVAALSARVKNYQERVEVLDKQVDEALNVEREYKALDRDYGILKGNYNKLVSRREALKISDSAEKSTDQIQFNIIEPPRAPFYPTSPNRMLLSSGVLLAGLGAGLALAIAMAMVRPAFYTRMDFSAVTDLPVLGSVSRILTPRERINRRMGYALYLGGVVVLLIAFGGLMTMYSLHIDIIDKIQGLVA